MSGSRGSPNYISDSMLGSLDYDYNYDGGNDRHSGFGGYGSHSGSGQEACCPLVVDAMCLAAILLGIGGAAVLLGRVFEIELTATGRRKKRSAELEGGIWLPALDGKHPLTIKHPNNVSDLN